MIVKPNFNLIKTKLGNVENILDISNQTLKIVRHTPDEINYLKIVATGYGKSKGSTDFVSKNIDKCIPVRMESYPLPGFITKDNIPCINTFVLPSKNVSDFSSADVFSMYLYTILLQRYIKNKPFEKDIKDSVTDFIFGVFVKFFGKKYGLMGTYKYLIPSLQGFVAMYVAAAFMGETIEKQDIVKISNKYYTDMFEHNLDFDFSSILGLFKALRMNNILPITENVFATTMINVAGISCIPMFEDMSRFFATMVASSVSGSSVFSSTFRKVNVRLYDKIVQSGMKAAISGK